MRAIDRSSDAFSPGLDAETRLRLLRENGRFALAYSAAFQPDMGYFGDEEGFLAYKRVGGTAFVLSDPLAPRGRHEDLIDRFLKARNDVCFWQASRSVAEILAPRGFRVNAMGIETRVALDDYDFDGPRKRNFRAAVNRAARRGYTIVERRAASLDRKELETVSVRWRRALGIKNREMTFLTRPTILADEVDVRKFFAFDHNGELQAFAFFDPIYDSGAIVGYLCSAKRRLPEADALVGYAILKAAIETFRDEGKRILSLGLSPLCSIADKDLGYDQLVSFGFRLVYRSRLFNKFIYPLRGIAEHKGSFGGSSEPAYCAFKGGCALTRLLKMPRACNLV